jgi:tight adherence protein C
MNTMLLEVAIGVLLCGLGSLLVGLRLRQPRRVLNQRLNRHGAGTSRSPQQSNDTLSYAQHLTLPRWAATLLLPLARTGEQLAGTERDRQQLRRLLAMAGLHAHEALGLLVASKYLLALLLVALGLTLLPAEARWSLNGFVVALVALFAGTQLPDLWLRRRARHRGGRIEEALPDALDLLSICAEAGLPLGRALQVVSRELALSSPALAAELHLTCVELQLLNDRAQALQNLATRTGVASVESLVATLLQAERYGTPLTKALRTIAVESRKRMLLALEEQAGKLPAQLSIPLMALILPPIVVIMGAPAMIRIVRLLGS